MESPYGDEEPFEHVFDMTFESALCEVFDEGVLRTDYGMIEGEAWDFVFANSRFLADYLESELSWDRDIEEVLSDIISENAGAEEYTLWDPLEYEDFNEYQKHHDTGSEKEGATPLYTLFDTYENYQQFMKGEFSLLRQSPVLWDMVASHAKNRFSGELSDVQTEIEGEVVTNIMNEFGAIFKKYGLDYTQLYSWMIVGESDS